MFDARFVRFNKLHSVLNNLLWNIVYHILARFYNQESSFNSLIITIGRIFLYHFQRYTLSAGFLTIDYILDTVKVYIYIYIYMNRRIHMISTYKLFRYNILRQTPKICECRHCGVCTISFFLNLISKRTREDITLWGKIKPHCVIISVWMTRRYFRVFIIDCISHLQRSIWLSSSVRH